MVHRRRIRALYPNFFGDNLIAYVALRILLYFNGPDIRADVMGICSEDSVRDFKKKKRRALNPPESAVRAFRVYRDAIPPGIIWSVARRIFKGETLARFAEFRFLASLRPGDLVYAWPSASVWLYRKLKERGYTVVSERINTLVISSKRILDAEYEAIGLPPSSHGLTNGAVDDELACMNLSDYIFSPSPAVTESIVSAGIPRSKVLESSYGLRNTDILPPRAATGGRSDTPVTAIFVGSVCVRKGIHLLLEAWNRSGVTAKLTVIGRVSPEVADMLAAAMSKNPNITHHDFMSDLKPVYAAADFFILPSLEEGSPLVTYLALGASLPLLVSPMGSGGVIEDGKEGMVIDPHDIDGFAQAIKLLVSDESIRRRMSAASGAKAPAYTWDKVAIRRLESLKVACPAHFAPKAKR